VSDPSLPQPTTPSIRHHAPKPKTDHTCDTVLIELAFRSIHMSSETTRRTVLQQIAGGATLATTVLPVLGQNPPPESHHSAQPVTKRAAAYVYRYFSPDQLQTLDAITETIIPTDSHSPGAKAAHVSEYIDAIVSDAPVHNKLLWTDGLAAVDRVAQQRFGHHYAECSNQQQAEVLTAFAGNEELGESLEGDFFQELKRATIDGYYTSRIGMFDDLQYIGNEPLREFPGCVHSSPEDHS
jgi:hypothetical protein